MISEKDKHQDPCSQQIALKKKQWVICYIDRGLEIESWFNISVRCQQFLTELCLEIFN